MEKTSTPDYLFHDGGHAVHPKQGREMTTKYSVEPTLAVVIQHLRFVPKLTTGFAWNV